MYEDIRYDTDVGVATITIDRPAVKNAFREATVAELNDAISRATEDDGVYAIILTGTDDAFCAGADVRAMPEWGERTEEEYAGFLWGVQNVVQRLQTGKPTIAAVNGPAIGAGCDFALACDVRYVGRNALLREGFVRVGLVPGDGGAWLLPKLIGRAKAAEYLLTGRDIDAETAVDLELATDAVDDPLAAARMFAGEVRDLPATAVQRTKALMDPSLSFEEYCKQAIGYQWECVNDDEHAEAIRAFAEERDPDYDRDYA